MKRLLLTIQGQQCPFRCCYCFAKFPQYEGTLSLEEVERQPTLLADADLIYPACDIDLFATQDPTRILWRAASLGLHISVSTKAHITTRVISELRDVCAWMREREKILKIGISLSTRNSIPRIEPGTASYAQRLHNLEQLADAPIVSALILKPLLAEVPLEEYLMILNDARRYTTTLLVGDEYVDETDSVATKLPRRMVNWLPQQPAWPVRPAAHRDKVISSARSLNYAVFQSDLDLMSALAKRGSRDSSERMTHA